MDEKSQLEPESQTKQPPSAKNDTGPEETEGTIETQDGTLPADNSAPENGADTVQTTFAPGKDPHPPGHDSTKSELGMDHESLPINDGDGKDFGTQKEDKESAIEDAKLEREGVRTESTQSGAAVESDFFESAEMEDIQGSSEVKAAAEETDNQQKDEGEAVAEEGEQEKSSDEVDAADVQEQTSGPSEEIPSDSYDAKRSVLKVALLSVAITFLFGGFFIFNNKPKMRTSTKTDIETHEHRVISQDIKKKALQNIQPSTASTGRAYGAQLQEITALRDTLLGINEEIQRLKAQYRDGIEELEKEVSDLSQKGEINTLQQAMENPAIAFALRTIQRRQVYIKELERPSEWIFSACEELLYIKRRTMMDILVAEIAGGIDMNKHIQHINAAVQKYQPTADRLTLDTTRTELEPLEAIWERILDQTRQYSSDQALSKNQIISEQICMGNFNRLSEITEVSPETATCINEMNGSDLFLNGLSEISPGAARQLFKWKGSWICLNGIRVLSPRVAHYLFQWGGNWVSLNGLTEFPAEIGEKLLQWGGNQLELMGLQYAEDFPERIAVEYLAQWERAGGKLFVTKSIRKKIDELNREPI